MDVMSNILLAVIALGAAIALVGLVFVLRGRKAREIGGSGMTRSVDPMQPQGNKAPPVVETLEPPKAMAELTAAERSAIAWLQDQFRSEIQEQSGIDISGDRMAQQRILEAIVAALIKLRTEEKTIINLPFIAADAKGPKHFERELTAIEAEAARS